jgi:hypothetical protein
VADAVGEVLAGGSSAAKAINGLLMSSAATSDVKCLCMAVYPDGGSVLSLFPGEWLPLIHIKRCHFDYWRLVACSDDATVPLPQLM